MLNVDGFGTQSLKVAKYKDFVGQAPGFRRGFKLFYSEDTEHDVPGAGDAPAAAAGRRRLRVASTVRRIDVALKVAVAVLLVAGRAACGCASARCSDGCGR